MSSENSIICADNKRPKNVKFENKMWQVLRTSSGMFNMANAFYDDRDFYKRQNESYVKVLTYYNQPHPKEKLFCHLWFETHFHDPLVVTAKTVPIRQAKYQINKDGYSPFVILCLNPFVVQSLIPSSVSIVENECDTATNDLKVIHNVPESKQKKSLAVCTKLFNYRDFDNEMIIIEWIEIMLHLKVDAIIFVVFDIHPKILRVLKFYVSLGKVRLEKMTYPIGYPKNASRDIQISDDDRLVYNDCLYRNMYEFSFLLPIDIDELIVPSRPEDKTLTDLLDRVIKKGKLRQENLFSTYRVRQTLFAANNNHQGEIQPEVPANFHFLQRIYRSRNVMYPRFSPKSFINTDIVTMTSQHWAFMCNDSDACEIFNVHPDDAKCNHYRARLYNYMPELYSDDNTNTTRDTTLWKYKDEVIENVHKTIESLKSFDDNDVVG